MKKRKYYKIQAFSLIELSVVILIIGVIVAGVTLGRYLIDKSRLTNARTLTQSSPVNSIDNGPVIWYESSLERSFVSDQQVNGTPLSGWVNITNNNIVSRVDASQTTSNNQPTYANTINSVPAVRFDGTNSYFNFDGSFLNNSDYTIFVVEARESNKADNYFFGDNAVTTTNQNLVLGYSANNQVIHKQGSGNTYTSNIAPYDTNHSPKIFTFIQDTNNGKNTYINSYHTGTSNDATQLQNIGTVTLAKSYQGQIGELIIFPRALTTNERQDVELYLANKWTIDTPLKNASNASASTDCTSGTLIGNLCDSGTCNVAITGISTTTVSNGSGSLSCSTGYTGGPVTYTCSHSALSSSGSCSAVTCSITSQTGLANQSGLAYTTTPTSLTCQSGYSGSPTYTCTSAGAATISGSCTPITCSITSQTGLANQSGLAYTTTPTSLTCQSGYSGSPTYTCTSTGAATISGSCTAITCSITSQTGLSNQSGLAYASSATAIPGGCSSGYSGSPTYTCTTTGAATIVSGCSASSCGASTSYTIITGGVTYTVPASVCTVKIWAIGGGGGGAGSPASDGTSGGGGGAGGTVYKTATVAPGDIINLSVGGGGGGGNGASSGSAGGTTTVTVGGVTITAYGGNGGIYNTGSTTSGGSYSGGDGGASGGSGGGAAGDQGGGAGGAIGGSAGATSNNAAGQTGANSSNVSSLFTAITALSYSSTSGGTASDASGSPANAKNGGNATGFGCGGGSAGWYGGNGGSGYLGGGGGGAAGFGAIQTGGSGGSGVVVIKLN